jgi:anthranilate synthase component 1
MHIGSTIRGILCKDKDAVDAIGAVAARRNSFRRAQAPGLRNHQRLENNKRGIYGGAIGFFDFSGNLDVCIAIRIAFKKNGKVFIRSGAGIVADSVPGNEYQECINKAKAVVVRALETAQGGIGR